MTEKKSAVMANENVQAYYAQLIENSLKEYEIAKIAKSRGKDISLEVESKPAMDLADRTENIIGPVGVAKRFRELYAQYNGNRIKAIFHIFKEIVAPEQCENQWCVLEGREKRLDQAIRTALVLVTEGVVIAPLDGVSRILISKNPDGSQYVDIYYAGPIRAAGGTAAVFPLILGDYAQKLLGLDRYKPTETEVERYVEECTMYEEEVISRQYKLGEEEIRKIIRGCPVCINGEPTEEKEVEFHRDLERIQTNRIRSGVCLVISEGVALKAPKILSYSKILGLDWSWLEGIIKVKKSSGGEDSKVSENLKYLEKIAAGRPIFSYPLRYGGFRIRYGRTRNTGIMGKAIHPATMHLLEDFIAVGTQMKLERPGKAAGIFACDSIEAPIVKLLNDSVVKIKSLEEAKRLRPQVKKLLYLGDFLVSYGDFRKSGHPLVPAGYCSEWWKLEMKKAIAEGKTTTMDSQSILQQPDSIDAKTAIQLSESLRIPLHPDYLHYYNAIEKKPFHELLKSFQQAQYNAEKESLKIPWSEETKNSLEKMGVPHQLESGWIVFPNDQSQAMAKTFGLESKKIENETDWVGETPCEILSNISGLHIRDKGGTFVGTRMGRPEAAKERKMVGSPHVLFPIALSGGATRSINKAMQSEVLNASNEGTIEVEIALFECPQCSEFKETPYCPECKARTIKRFQCARCGRMEKTNFCSACRVPAPAYSLRKIQLNELMRNAAKRIQCKIPTIVKGVKGMINDEKVPEPLEKGILRAHHNIHVFRDATIRFDMLNAPISHFKPIELGLTVEQSKSLGYTIDMHGKPLERDDQMCELFVQDVIINEDSAAFFIRVTQFLDDLLEKFYEMPRFYNITQKEELVGQLMLALAPHTSAAVVGRILGFTKARVCFAHPFFHLAKRRNIDGDQDSMMMLLDGLLNFSEQYLASSRGNRMDAPLVFSMAIDPREIDDEAYEMETCTEYPIELYEQSLRMTPAEVDGIPRVLHKLGTTEQYSGLNFTHDTALFDEGPKVSQYVQLGAMEEKIRVQAKLQSKIAAVDQKDALERVINYHFLPDIIGNTRAFSRQTFRCTKCNNKYRRLPLVGKCTKCGGNIILTIAQGSVRKYLELAKEIVTQYHLSDYIAQRLVLAEKEINSVFQNDKVQQKNLFEYV